MAYQATFQRYEAKYLLTALEKEQILKKMSAHMRLDAYGRTTIRNIYFDTDSYRLIRRSLEKPVYKEKLRMRSYQAVGPEDPVFVELKKKFQSVVYKRRLVLPEQEAMTCFRRGAPLPAQSQIAREIEYFRTYYQSLHPAVFLSYEREAYYALDGSDFRVTLDENILYRQNDLWLGSNVYGYPLLRDGIYAHGSENFRRFSPVDEPHAGAPACVSNVIFQVWRGLSAHDDQSGRAAGCLNKR